MNTTAEPTEAWPLWFLLAVLREIANKGPTQSDDEILKSWDEAVAYQKQRQRFEALEDLQAFPLRSEAVQATPEPLPIPIPLQEELPLPQEPTRERKKPEQHWETSLPNDAFVGAKVCAEAFGTSTSTLGRWRAAKIGPRFAKYGGGKKGIHYNVGEIRRALRQVNQLGEPQPWPDE